jgi:hypothetical protein
MLEFARSSQAPFSNPENEPDDFVSLVGSACDPVDLAFHFALTLI